MQPKLLSQGLLGAGAALNIQEQRAVRRQDGPIDPGTAPDCTCYDTAYDESMDCQYFEDSWSLSHADFVNYNPSVKDDCSGIKVGNSYCVEVNYGFPRPTTVSSSSTVLIYRSHGNGRTVLEGCASLPLYHAYLEGAETATKVVSLMLPFVSHGALAPLSASRLRSACGMASGPNAAFLSAFAALKSTLEKMAKISNVSASRSASSQSTRASLLRIDITIFNITLTSAELGLPPVHNLTALRRSGLFQKAAHLALWKVRSILHHALQHVDLRRRYPNKKLVSPSAARRWLKPWAQTSSRGTLIGASWEVCRVSNLTKDERLIELYSKGGDVFTYHAHFTLIPEYDLVMMTRVTGPEVSGGAVQTATGEVLKALLPAIEPAGKGDAEVSYAETYVDKVTTSTLSLSLDDNPGSSQANWIVRGVDIIANWETISFTGLSLP
ncbi:hypothetical protein DL765_004428 [Monosporascus sp. GIB2]|nr:hypothetical protein DL765_004428 [Monosporascus sp. GIB2]